MASESPDESREAIIDQLTGQAKLLWGEEKAETLRGAIEETARLLETLRLNLPQAEVEPGFYQ